MNHRTGMRFHCAGKKRWWDEKENWSWSERFSTRLASSSKEKSFSAWDVFRENLCSWQPVPIQNAFVNFIYHSVCVSESEKCAQFCVWAAACKRFYRSYKHLFMLKATVTWRSTQAPSEAEVFFDARIYGAGEGIRFCLFSLFISLLLCWGWAILKADSRFKDFLFSSPISPY